MTPKQGKNVPQGPESATNSSADSIAIPCQSAQVLCVERVLLLHRCNKYARQLIELPADLPYLSGYKSNWTPVFGSHKLELG
jgi:hypothetical protein